MDEIPHGRDIAALSTQVIDSLNGLKQNAKLVLQQNPPEPKDFNPHSPDEAGILSALATSYGLEFSILLIANRGGDGGPDG